MSEPYIFEAEPRRPFTDAQKYAILAKQADTNGVVKYGCGCGETIAVLKGSRWTALKPLEFHHLKALSQGGAHEVGNGSAWRKKCHRAYSGPEWERTSKAKRQGGEVGQFNRQKLLGSKFPGRWRGR